jgi:hypothetical protein
LPRPEAALSSGAVAGVPGGEVAERDSLEGAIADLSMNRQCLHVAVVGRAEITRVEIEAREVRDESPFGQSIAVCTMDGHRGLVRCPRCDQVATLEREVREREERAPFPEVVACSPVQRDRATEELGRVVEAALTHRDGPEVLEHHGLSAASFSSSSATSADSYEARARGKSPRCIASIGPGPRCAALPQRSRPFDRALRGVGMTVADVRAPVRSKACLHRFCSVRARARRRAARGGRRSGPTPRAGSSAAAIRAETSMSRAVCRRGGDSGLANRARADAPQACGSRAPQRDEMRGVAFVDALGIGDAPRGRPGSIRTS